MKIVNSIGWKTPWLEEVVGYCCVENGYLAERVNRATFRRAHNCAFRGWADMTFHEIRIKINPCNRYPCTDAGPRGLRPVILADAVEVLVLVTAHEVAHIARWDLFARERKSWGWWRDTDCERETESMARSVLDSFRVDRERLLDEWGESGDGPIPPKYIYGVECRSCGSQSVYHRPSRKLYCVACHGDYMKTWTPDMPPPPLLECRRIPFAEASA